METDVILHEEERESVSSDSWNHLALSPAAFSTPFYLPPSYCSSPFAITVSWLYEAEGRELMAPQRMASLGEQKSTPNLLLLNEGCWISKSKKKSWPTVPSLPGTLQVSEPRVPHTSLQTPQLWANWDDGSPWCGCTFVRSPSLPNSCLLSLANIKFCLKQKSLCFFSFSERSQNY